MSKPSKTLPVKVMTYIYTTTMRIYPPRMTLRDFILHRIYPGHMADHIDAVLDRANPGDRQQNSGVPIPNAVRRRSILFLPKGCS